MRTATSRRVAKNANHEPNPPTVAPDMTAINVEVALSIARIVKRMPIDAPTKKNEAIQSRSTNEDGGVFFRASRSACVVAISVASRVWAFQSDNDGHNRAAAVDAPLENARSAAPRSCHGYPASSGWFSMSKPIRNSIATFSVGTKSSGSNPFLIR